MNQPKRLNTFRLMCWLGTVLFTLLFVLLVIDPNSFTEGACAAGGEIVYFISRRVAVMMFSFALLLFLSRNAELSSLRRGVCVTIAICMAGFAATGIHEYVTGGIGASIFMSVTIELIYSIMFASQAVSDSIKLRGTVGK